MKLETVELDQATRRKWIETRSAVLWKAPAFTHLLFSMLNPTKGELAALFTKDVPIAATDGSNLILNPDTFFKYSLDERVFITAHEILHCVFNHCALRRSMRQSGKVQYADGTTLPYDAKLMNVAMDLVINDILIHDKIGSFPKEGCHDPSIATKDDTFLESYRKVFKQDEQDKKQGGQGGGITSAGKNGGGFDQHLDPGTGQGKDPAQATAERSQVAWDTAVASAIASAKAQGKLSAALENLFKDMIEPVVTWTDHIRAFFARKVGGGSFDWRKPDRRFIQRDIFAPARSGNGCGTVVVGFDTSGSIYADPGLIDRFIAEVGGILSDLKPREVIILWCDAQVHRYDEVDQMTDLMGLKPVGGGGTRFEPVFDWVEDNGVQPDALVYLTDGLGSFPAQAPAYPVLWGNISKPGYVKYPFGDVVDIPVAK